MRNDPFESLNSFYQSLDAIPTPNLQVSKPRAGGFWRWAAAPFAASLFAYIFMSICASAPGDAHPSLPAELGIDRYAIKELKSESSAEAIRPFHVANSYRKLQS